MITRFVKLEFLLKIEQKGR